MGLFSGGGISGAFGGGGLEDIFRIGGDPITGRATDDAFGFGGDDDEQVAGRSQEQITTANLFRNLSPEQQKDLLINNPNIVTAQGKQFFDPLTNTIRLEESEFQTGQRGRQEQLASELSGQLLGQDLPGTDPSARFEAGRELFQPAFQQQRERLEQQLADQGIPRGSEAFGKELNRLEQSQGTQLRQLAQESVATSEAQRAARFNEISSLLGQQQVGGIGFGGFQPQASGLDLFGAEQAGLNRQFQAEQAGKDRSAARSAALIGAAGSLGGAAIGSDIRLKENIEKVGFSESGIPIYEFDYIDKSYGKDRYIGTMAQDLIETNPNALIMNDNGYFSVDYNVIDVDFKKV